MERSLIEIALVPMIATAGALRGLLASQPEPTGSTAVIALSALLVALAGHLLMSGVLTKAGRRDRAIRAALRRRRTDRDGWSTIANVTLEGGPRIVAMSVDAKLKRNGHGALDLRVRRSDQSLPTFARTTPKGKVVEVTHADLGITRREHAQATRPAAWFDHIGPKREDADGNIPKIDLDLPFAECIALGFGAKGAF